MAKNIKLKIEKQKNKLTCKECSLLYKAFIDGTLSEKEELDFTHHVTNCETCLEDLKEYYMFATAFHYLDNNDDTALPSDVTTLLNEVLNIEKENSRRSKAVVFILLSSVAVIALLISILLEGFWWL